MNLLLVDSTTGSVHSLRRGCRNLPVILLVSCHTTNFAVKWRLIQGSLSLSGWMCALGWQSFVPGAANVGASILVGFAVVANDSYVPQNWHIVTLTILICSFAIIFNVFLARKLPGIEATVFLMYILTFVAVFIVFIAMGPRSSAKEIFTDFQDNAGWGSIGTACFAGVSGPVITLIGSDSAVHLAEELKDASRQLPKAMLGTAGVNYLLGFAMLVAFIAVVGNVDQVLATATGQPWIQVLWNATQSRNATLTITFFVVFFFLFSAVNSNTTSSRQLYAFSRDGGLPFSSWISYVSLSFWRAIQQRKDTNRIQGVTHKERTCSCRLSHLAYRLWTCPHTSRFYRCFCKHSDHRQLWTHNLLHDLHCLPNASSQHCRCLW